MEPPGAPPAPPAPPGTPPGTPHEHHKHRHRAEQDREAGPREHRNDLGEGRSQADKPNDSEAKSGRSHDLRLKGRILALAELSHRHEIIVGTTGMLEPHDRDALDLALQSGRFGLTYHSPLRLVSAQLELEVAGKPRVKDAFLEAGKTFFVRAGQFKIPASTLELESSWKLPLARRGQVHDLMTSWLDIAGRRPGVAAGYRGKGSLKPRLSVGAFQGTTLKTVVPGDRNTQLIDHANLSAQTFAARAQVSLAAVTLGAWFEQRVGSVAVGSFSHFATLGVDAELAQRFESGALRVWVDGSAGESLYVNDEMPGSDPYPWFVAGRALVGYRFGGLGSGDPYLEPFGFLALMDPDTEVVADLTTEAALGVAVGFWDRAKITLEGDFTRAGRNFPTGFLDNQNPEHMSLLLQAGARF
jgi:hypothetical protein